MEFSHVSVLLKETVDGAFTDPKGVYADLTTGGGGHSLELAKLSLIHISEPTRH